jgi:hypothetical protein
MNTEIDINNIKKLTEEGRVRRMSEAEAMIPFINGRIETAARKGDNSVYAAWNYGGRGRCVTREQHLWLTEYYVTRGFKVIPADVTGHVTVSW